MSDINHSGVRTYVRNYSLHRADEPIIHSEIGRQRDNAHLMQLRMCSNNGPRLCRRPAAGSLIWSSSARNIDIAYPVQACCGWSSTQPRSFLVVATKLIRSRARLSREAPESELQSREILQQQPAITLPISLRQVA